MKVYGHRGASGYAPENTLEAFEYAFKIGCDGIENDVYMTLDGEIIVSHDKSTLRASGVDLDVTKSTLERLKELNLCGAFAQKYPNVKMPTLRETYKLMQKYPDTIINVELKDVGENFLKKVLEIAIEYNMTNRVLYSTFSHDNLEWLKNNYPEIKTAVLFSAEYDYKIALKYNSVAIHPHFSAIKNDYINNAHDNKIQVNAWTVDDPKIIENLIELDIDGIISNFPDRVINQYQKCCSR